MRNPGIDQRVKALARHCAGLILIAMAAKEVDFDYLDVMLEIPDGKARSWTEALMDGKAENPSLKNLSFIMSALGMRIDVRLEPKPIQNEADLAGEAPPQNERLIEGENQ